MIKLKSAQRLFIVVTISTCLIGCGYKRVQFKQAKKELYSLFGRNSYIRLDPKKIPESFKDSVNTGDSVFTKNNSTIFAFQNREKTKNYVMVFWGRSKIGFYSIEADSSWNIINFYYTVRNIK